MAQAPDLASDQALVPAQAPGWVRAPGTAKAAAQEQESDQEA